MFATELVRRLFAGMLWLTAAAGMAQAGEIYKSIDANGNVVYSDHLDPSMSHSTTVQLDDPLFPPRELHFCWTNCFTLVLDHGVYRRADGADETWTVETFSAKAIVLHRHDAPADWNGYSQDVVYAGHVANDRLIGATVNGNPVSGVDASWGIALNTLPGSNAERDAGTTAKPKFSGTLSSAADPDSSSGTSSAANPDSSSGSTLSSGADPDSSSATVSSAAPPPLPGEEQPALPQDGYLWTPGYWYWRDQGYSWIPGAWVRPPRVGVLWTPGYWGFAGTVFVFHPGYWGSTVGFYGGVNYGYGYFGNGYSGGHWIGNAFAYNSAINRVNPAVAHQTYVESVPSNGSRGVVSHTGEPPGGAATRTASRHESLALAGDKPAATTVQPPAEHTPKPAEVGPAVVTTPPPRAAPPKPNHAPTQGGTPVRQ